MAVFFRYHISLYYISKKIDRYITTCFIDIYVNLVLFIILFKVPTLYDVYGLYDEFETRLVYERFLRFKINTCDHAIYDHNSRCNARISNGRNANHLSAIVLLTHLWSGDEWEPSFSQRTSNLAWQPNYL